MGFKLNMLTAVAVIAMPMTATAQGSYGSGASTNAAPAGAQEGMTKAEAASKKAADAKADKASVKAATEGDVKAGASVYDSKGGAVGKVESVDAKGAVVNTGKVKARIPLSSLARNDKGLVISMTASEIEAAANAKAK